MAGRCAVCLSLGCVLLQYCLASEAPLLLYSCSYEGLEFRRSAGNYQGVREVLSDMMNR